MPGSKAIQQRVFGEISVHHNDAPLYERAPTKDENGDLLTDFMMLIPRLNRCTTTELKLKLVGLQNALVQFEEVVFADLNLKINVLWVSLKPRRGLIEQIALRVQENVPEAKLVSGEFHRREVG